MRRSQAVLTALWFGAAAFAVPARARSDVTGSIAVQPTVPVRLATCTAVVAGNRFTPEVTFAPGSLAVTSSTVRMTFFDTANVSSGFVDVRTRGTFALPARAVSMTCAILREELADGTLFSTGTASDARAGASGLALIAQLAGQGPLATATPKSGAHPTAQPCMTPSGSPASPSPSQSGAAAPSPSPTPARNQRCR